MNACPPQPGLTLITSSRSIWSRYGSTVSTGVGGFSTRPTPTSRARSSSNSGRGSPSSTCTMQRSAPASAKSASSTPGLSTMRWQSRNRSVCARSDFTTGGPMVRLGTKWPSITSTCRRSATSAHPLDVGRRAGEVGGQDRRRQLHHGHAIGTRLSRCAAARGRTCRRCRRPAAAAARRGRGGSTVRPARGRAVEAGQCGASPVVDADGLRPGERAHRVDEHATRAHQRRRGGEQLALERGELVDRRPVPAASGRRGGGAARRCRCTGASSSTRSKQPSRSGGRRPSPTSGNRCGRPMRWRTPSIMRTRPASTSSATTAPLGPDPLGDRGGLAPGRGGDVGDPLPRRRRQHRDDRLAPLVLRRRPAVPHRGQAAGVADAPHDERVGHEAPALDLGAGGRAARRRARRR